MKTRLVQRIVHLLLFCCILYSTNTLGQSVICKLYSINGFEKEHDLGVHYNGENTTTEVRGSKLYCTVQGDQIYIQSNFVQNVTDSYPVKMATVKQDTYNGFMDYLMNIYVSGRSSLPPRSEVLDLINDIKLHTELTIDPSVLQSPSFGNLDFSEFKNLSFACPDREARPALHMLKPDGTTEYFIKYDDNISTRINGQNLDYIFKNLAGSKIKYNDVKVLSLVDNSYTDNVLSRNFPGQRIEFNYSSIDNFKAQLLENKDKRIVILGHIENGKFVTIDKGGNEIFTVGIDEIQKIQKENNLSMILLGCNAAKEGAASGPINKFTSAKALERLESTRNTDNVKEFLDSLSFGAFHFVVDQAFFAQRAAMLHKFHPKVITAALFAIQNNDTSVVTAASDIADRIDFSVVRIVPESNRLRKGTVGQVIFMGLGSNISTDQSQASIDQPKTDTEDSGGWGRIVLWIVGIIVVLAIIGRVFKN